MNLSKQSHKYTVINMFETISWNKEMISVKWFGGDQNSHQREVAESGICVRQTCLDSVYSIYIQLWKSPSTVKLVLILERLLFHHFLVSVSERVSKWVSSPWLSPLSSLFYGHWTLTVLERPCWVWLPGVSPGEASGFTAAPHYQETVARATTY